MQNHFTDHDVLIAKYLDNTDLSQEEKNILEDWVNASDKNRTYFEQTSKAWEKSIIELQDKAPVQTRLSLYFERLAKGRKRELYKWSIGIAAIAIFMFTGFLLFQSDFSLGKKMLMVDAGNTKQEITLPDGSIVWLNAHSSLKYPSKFKRGRDVILTGEAYFDVEKNEKIPFTVTTENLTIEVKGTTFLVTDRAEAENCEAVLESGTINLTINSSGKKIEMKPNQQIIYDRKTGETTLHEVNAADYIGWKADNLVFENTPLSDVFIQLEKWYNTNIECTKESVLKTPVSFTVDEESIDEVLGLLQHITHITWKKTSDNKIIIQ